MWDRKITDSARRPDRKMWDRKIKESIFMSHIFLFSLARLIANPDWSRRGHAEFVESLLQFIGDLLGAASLDLVAFHHINQLAALQQRD